jgi:hypothetical protein
MSTILPSQRVSDKERQKAEWYIPTIDYIINKAISLNAENKIEVASNLGAAEGIIDDSTYNYVLKAYGITDKNLDIPNTVRNTSLILPIKRRYIGEFIRQYKNYTVYHKDINAIKQRNSNLAIQLEQLISQELINTLNESGLASGGQTKEIPNIGKFIKDFEENWIDEKILESEKILKLFDTLNDSDIKYIKAFYYYWATDEVYSYRRVIDNNLVKEIINPLEYYRIPSGNDFVEDDDMGMRKYQLTFNQINEQFSKKLSDSDLNYLRSIENHINSSNSNTNLLSDKVLDLNKYRSEYNYLYTLPEFNNSINSTNDLSNFLWIYHTVFKSEQEIGFLKYIDSLGQVQEKIVEGNYKLQPELGDIEITREWISRYYQAWRIGPEHTGIYIKPELIEPQRQDINSINKCKSPYNGITGTFDNNIRNSIAKLLKPYEALYRIYQYQRERAVAKYRAGMYVVPQSLITDSESMTMEQQINFNKRDDTLYINDTDANVNSLQALRYIGSQGAERYIQVLTELTNAIKNEAMEIADMNPQRFGDINQNAGKGTTETAISNAQLGSILLFTLFNKFVEKDKESDIDHLKVAWINGKKGTFFDKKENKIIYVDVNGDDFYNRNIGIFVGNSTINDEKLKQFRQLAYNASQNGQFDIAADAIELENSTEIHKLIKDVTIKREELQAQQTQQQNETQQLISNNLLKDKQEQRQFDKYKVDEDNATKIKVAEIQANSNESVNAFKMQTSIENNINKQDKQLDKLVVDK